MQEIDLRDVRMGVYRHYKGGLYLVVGLARDANADTLIEVNTAHRLNDKHFSPATLGERMCVVYQSMTIEGKKFGPCWAIRSLDDFMGWADITDEQLQQITKNNETHSNDLLAQISVGTRRLVDGGDQLIAKRFTFLGPIYWPSMA